MQQRTTMKDCFVNATEKDLSDVESAGKGYDSPSFQRDENLEQSDQLKPKKKKKENEKPEKRVVDIFELFRYADWVDVLLMVVGLIAAVANGTGLPLMIIVFGEMTNSFVLSGVKSNVSEDTSVNSSSCPPIPGIDIEGEMTKFAYYYVGIGCAVLILSTIQVWTFLIAATRQTARIRQKFFFAVLHQEMAWFDTTQIGMLNTRLTDDINTIHEGIGDKICIFVQFFATFLAGIIIGFIHGWKLTLVILSVSPLLAASAAVWSTLLASLTAKELSAYAKAGAVAEEILTAIRTVVAFNGQQKASAKYDANLEMARSVGVKKSITTNTSLGVSQFLIFGSYALAFWYGTNLTAEEENYDIGRVLIVFFSVLIGAFSLGQAAPNLESVANARGAAYEVYQIINKKRLIDSSSEEGYKPDKLIGEIEFRNIHFSYPSRPDVKILKGLNLKVQTGKTIALVGASGCGKSTTVHLLQRFYDPVQGEVNVTHLVDLSKEWNMTVTIHFEGWPRHIPLMSEPICLICKDPRTCDRVLTLVSGAVYKISFLCKDLSRLRITAEKGISCVDLRWCQRKIYSLSVPKAITQLPIRLHKFIWKLLAPDLINIEITSPSLKLQQHVPEQRCNTSYSYSIASATPETELNVGVFCPGGSIEKIQMRNNITISLKTFSKGFLNESNHQDLKMSFVPHIKDECTFTVSPDPKAKVYLQTPNWPYGLPPYVSISWYILVPSKQVARLGFSKDRMGIACETGRAYVNIKEETLGAEETVCREDELLPEPRNMYHNFWVNVSNCKPVDKTQLTLQFWVTFADKQIDLGVILAVVAGAGVLAAIGLTVCCVKKKKKKNQNPMVGVYNPNVNTQVPGKQGLFTKGRKNNESHVYAVIDDAMVYGHLLKESNGSVAPEVDVYRPFDGPIGSLPPSPPPLSFRKDVKRSSNSEEPPPLTDTDHDTYTFAHQKSGQSEDNGDTNEKNNRDMSMSLLENKEQDGLVE